MEHPQYLIYNPLWIKIRQTNPTIKLNSEIDKRFHDKLQLLKSYYKIISKYKNRIIK